MVCASPPGDSGAQLRVFPAPHDSVHPTADPGLGRTPVLLILLLAAGAASISPPQHSGTGTIRATARVVDLATERAAAAQAGQSPGSATLPPLPADPRDLPDWIRSIDGERSVEGATVRYEFTPATPQEPAILQVEWTSN